MRILQANGRSKCKDIALAESSRKERSSSSQIPVSPLGVNHVPLFSHKPDAI